MKNGIILILIFFFKIAIAQLPPNFNLVPNPSFEHNTKNLWQAIDDTDFVNTICWIKANRNAVPIGQFDSMNLLNPLVPLPHSGRSFGTLLSYHPQFHANSLEITDSNTNFDLKTYYQTRLLEPMIIGQKYYISMYIGVTKREDLIGAVSAPVENIGVLFTKNKVSDFNNSGRINLLPQIKFTNWDITQMETFEYTQVKAVYTATGGEQFITIGNFDYFIDFKYLNVPFIDTLIWGNDIIQGESYQSIDDIVILRDTTLPSISLQTFDLGKDTTICPNTTFSKMIGGQSNFFHYYWNTGDTTQFITVNQPGQYICKADFGCSWVADTLNIKIQEPPENFSIGNDTIVCAGQDIILNAPNGYTYLWSTGDTTQQIIIDSTQYVICTIYNKCDSARAGRKIDFLKTNIGGNIVYGNTNLCNNGSINYCQVYANSSNNLLWYNGDTSHSINISEKGIYWLKEYNQCGENIDTFQITGCIPFVVFPTAFSPNQDGKNDDFKPITKNVDELQYSIYNRYGNCVFTNDNALFGWDGKYKTVNCPMGTYFYICKYKINNQTKILKGDFELIR